MTDTSRYARLIVHLFETHHCPGQTEVVFVRQELEHAADSLDMPLPKNLGDVIYSFQHRTPLPDQIQDTAPPDRKWMLVNKGVGRYAFELRTTVRFRPRARLAVTKVPDATPGVVAKYALDDEQALLTRLRYNRLLDIFSGLACYSLQNHLRTTVPDLGQVETDEIYVGLDKWGRHYVLPVQAKGGQDEIGVVQIEQDIALCKFPDLICRAVAAQFMAGGVIALFAFELDTHGEVCIVDERHYRLVSPEELSEEELAQYRQRGNPDG